MLKENVLSNYFLLAQYVVFVCFWIRSCFCLFVRMSVWFVSCVIFLAFLTSGWYIPCSFIRLKRYMSYATFWIYFKSMHIYLSTCTWLMIGSSYASCYNKTDLAWPVAKRESVICDIFFTYFAQFSNLWKH